MDTSTDVRRQVSTLRVVLAVTCLLVGIAVLVWPLRTLLVVALLFGLELIISGGIRLALALVEPEPRSRRVLTVLLAVLTIAAGLFCIARPGASLLFLVIAVAVGWLLDGISEIVSGLRKGRTSEERRSLLLFGVLSVVAGVVLLVLPGETLVVLTRTGGVVLILFAVVTLLTAVATRRGARRSATATA